MAWGLAPQLACFMPDEMRAEEKDCCEGMTHDCGGPNMSHDCCRTIVRTDIGISTKTIRNVMPAVDAAERTIDIAPLLLPTVSRDSWTRNDHAPPEKPGVSTPILRI
jgi:hypothetical protein